MTAADMLSYFELIQDKNGEPYFTDTETYLFLNAAQTDLFNSLIGGNVIQEPSMITVDERASRLLEPFILRTTALADASGIITYAAMKTDVSATENIIGVLEVVDAVSNAQATYIPSNNYQRRENNAFTQGATGDNIANYTYIDTGIEVSPSGRTWDIRVIKYPKDIASGVDSEFPEQSHHKIVSIALEKAGISTEAEGFTNINSITP